MTRLYAGPMQELCRTYYRKHLVRTLGESWCVENRHAGPDGDRPSWPCSRSLPIIGKSRRETERDRRRAHGATQYTAHARTDALAGRIGTFRGGSFFSSRRENKIPSPLADPDDKKGPRRVSSSHRGMAVVWLPGQSSTT